MTEPNPEFVQHINKRLIESNVPKGMHTSLIHYITERRPVGHFLTAILSNDLAEACSRADDNNKYGLCNFIYFLYNYAPSPYWHSKENVESWLKDTEPVRPKF